MKSTEEIIKFIATSKKKTPVKVYVNFNADVEFPETLEVYGEGNSRVIFADFADWVEFYEANKAVVVNHRVENDRRNSGVPMIDLTQFNARIEPGCSSREHVSIGDNAVSMMLHQYV